MLTPLAIYFLLAIHAVVRWVIVIIGIIAVCTLAQGWLSKRPYSRFDRGISLSFSLSMALQFLLGLILFLWMGFAGGGVTPARIVHAVILTGARLRICHAPSVETS